MGDKRIGWVVLSSVWLGIVENLSWLSLFGGVKAIRMGDRTGRGFGLSFLWFGPAGSRWSGGCGFRRIRPVRRGVGPASLGQAAARVSALFAAPWRCRREGALERCCPRSLTGYSWLVRALVGDTPRVVRER
jgi:hypothetical protein